MKTLRSLAVTTAFALSFAGAALAQSTAAPGAPSITPSGVPMTAPLPSGTPPEKMAPAGTTTTTTSTTTTTTMTATAMCKTRRAEGSRCSCVSAPTTFGTAKADAEGVMRCMAP